MSATAPTKTNRTFGAGEFQARTGATEYFTRLMTQLGVITPIQPYPGANRRFTDEHVLAACEWMKTSPLAAPRRGE
jgi:hypothetical protein